MKIIKYKKNIINIADIWFPNISWKNVKADIARLHCIERKNLGIKEEYLIVQHTLYTDLTQSEEKLKSNITSKNLKYEIRRSERDGIIIKYFVGKEILEHNNLLEEFKNCYNKMFKEKGKNITMNLDVIREYAAEGLLIMSIAFYMGKPVAFHSYIDGKNRVRFFHSCSDFRTEKEQAQVIGRANKRLHWEDMMYFKMNGYITYDWGGVFAFNSDNGIDMFKRAFGGKPVDYYNAEIPISLLGKISMIAQKRLRR